MRNCFSFVRLASDAGYGNFVGSGGGIFRFGQLQVVHVVRALTLPILFGMF